MFDNDTWFEDDEEDEKDRNDEGSYENEEDEDDNQNKDNEEGKWFDLDEDELLKLAIQLSLKESGENQGLFPPLFSLYSLMSFEVVFLV